MKGVTEGYSKGYQVRFQSSGDVLFCENGCPIEGEGTRYWVANEEDRECYSLLCDDCHSDL